MIPIFIDPARARVALAGNGALAARRLEWLRGLGASPAVFSPEPEPDFRAAAGAALQPGLPGEAALRGLAALWIADLPAPEAESLAARARALNVLVNVEDVKPLCAFHTPAVVRRGRLLLAAGTGGASPAAAALVRERLEQVFPASWEGALEELAEARAALRASGASLEAISADARARLARLGLIDRAV